MHTNVLGTNRVLGTVCSNYHKIGAYLRAPVIERSGSLSVKGKSEPRNHDHNCCLQLFLWLQKLIINYIQMSTLTMLTCLLVGIACAISYIHFDIQLTPPLVKRRANMKWFAAVLVICMLAVNGAVGSIFDNVGCKSHA